MGDKWHGGKGDKQRPLKVSREELALRDALWREKDEKKKAEIKKQLELIK